MPGTPTTNYAIPTVVGTDLARDLDTTITSISTAIDGKMVGYSAGLLAARPPSTGGSPGVAGRLYRATDTGQIFQDTGTGWDELGIVPIAADDLATADAQRLGLSQAGAVRRGKSIIAAEHTRTNVAYGKLGATPGVDADQVSGIVLPTDGLLCVAYSALAKSSVAAAGFAAIFLGANQLKQTVDNVAVPPVQETRLNNIANTYAPLWTTSRGLLGDFNAATGSGSPVTSGQSLAGAAGGVTGGVCVVFAAAGTYDVSVQFRADSGSVSAKDRRLWVWTMGF